MQILSCKLTAKQEFIGVGEGVSKVQLHALKGQKLIAQGSALGNNKNKTKGSL